MSPAYTHLTKDQLERNIDTVRKAILHHENPEELYQTYDALQDVHAKRFGRFHDMDGMLEVCLKHRRVSGKD